MAMLSIRADYVIDPPPLEAPPAAALLNMGTSAKLLRKLRQAARIMRSTLQHGRRSKDAAGQISKLRHLSAQCLNGGEAAAHA